MNVEHSLKENSSTEPFSEEQMTKAELMLIKQEHIFIFNLDSVRKKLKNRALMAKTSRYAKEKLGETLTDCNKKLEKIRIIKEKYSI